MKTVRIALTAAALWAAGLGVAALTLPAYEGTSTTVDSTGEMTSTTTTATLVQTNGPWGLVVACLPLAVCLVVAALLLGPGGRAAQWAALVPVALLAAVTLLSLLTIGVFIAPVTAGLGVAVISALGAAPRPVTP